MDTYIIVHFNLFLAAADSVQSSSPVVPSLNNLAPNPPCAPETPPASTGTPPATPTTSSPAVSTTGSSSVNTPASSTPATSHSAASSTASTLTTQSPAFPLVPFQTFDWDGYIKETNGIAAPPHLFKQVFYLLFYFN